MYLCLLPLSAPTHPGIVQTNADKTRTEKIHGESLLARFFALGLFLIGVTGVRSCVVFECSRSSVESFGMLVYPIGAGEGCHPCQTRVEEGVPSCFLGLVGIVVRVGVGRRVVVGAMFMVFDVNVSVETRIVASQLVTRTVASVAVRLR